MPRNMSFSMTTEQIRNRTKTVTRRVGWKFLEAGDELWAVEKAMGLKKGEKVKRLCLIRVVSVWREPLDDLIRYWCTATRRELPMEGFPLMAPREFVDFFCEANRCEEDAQVTRIEFEYVGDAKRIRERTS